MKKIVYTLICCAAVVCIVGCNITPDKIQQETVRVIPRVQSVASAVSEQELTGDDMTDWIALIQAGNAASAPFNPYAVPVGAGLALLTAIMGAFAKKKNDEAIKADAKYQSHKQGVESSIKDMRISNDASMKKGADLFDKVLYDNIGLARKKNGV